jgi:hypothetical protein
MPCRSCLAPSSWPLASLRLPSSSLGAWVANSPGRNLELLGATLTRVPEDGSRSWHDTGGLGRAQAADGRGRTLRRLALARLTALVPRAAPYGVCGRNQLALYRALNFGVCVWAQRGDERGHLCGINKHKRACNATKRFKWPWPAAGRLSHPLTSCCWWAWVEGGGPGANFASFWFDSDEREHPPGVAACCASREIPSMQHDPH